MVSGSVDHAPPAKGDGPSIQAYAWTVRSSTDSPCYATATDQRQNDQRGFSVFSKISKKNEATSQVAESGNCDVAVGLGGLLEPQIFDRGVVGVSHSQRDCPPSKSGGRSSK